MKARLHFLLIALFSSSLFANSVSESQSKWYNKYKKQANVPKIEDMLINTESEPDLKTGFVDLYNKKDLNGWTPLGGYCKFEANGDLITGTCVPKSPSTYFSIKNQIIKTLSSPVKSNGKLMATLESCLELVSKKVKIKKGI